MNLQQTVQKPSANGHARRRGDRDVGARVENKFHSGKSYSHKSAPMGSMTGKKVGSSGSPLRDRLVYLTTCLIGHHVEVQVKNGSIYTGIFHATDAENDFGVILRMARLTKDTTPGQKALAESISKAPSKTFIIPAKELVQVIAKDVAVTRDGLLSEVQHEKQQDLMLDCSISQSRHAEGERELEPWVPDEDDPQCPELDDIFDGHWNRSWDQFQTNEMLFGVKSTFNEELYTTKLDRGPQTRELEREALRIAREIEGEDTQDLHLAEERGVYLHDKFDIDEETRFSSVYRGKVDDSGYEETEDIMFDTHNDETFGGSSDPTIQSSTDMSHGGHNDDAQASSSSSSLDQAQLSQSSVHLDMGCSSSYDHAKQQASESPLKNESRIQENVLTDKHEAEKNSESIKKLTEADNCILLTSEDSQSSLSGRKDGSDLEGLSRNSPSYAPSCTSRKVNEKSSLAELVEGSTSGKAHGEIQTWNNRGRPGSSASSNSDGVIASASAAAATAAAAAAAAAIGPGLSPSTSMGSLSPEKSTLNPYAKEFKLNPNAKSFTPSKTPTRSPSPASDGSFYYQNNTAAISQIHAMPFGVGIGAAFAGQQPVIFNSHVPPMQSPQPYFQPNGPQYGQPMLLGHPRQVVYMPGYPPEMQYKGREY